MEVLPSSQFSHTTNEFHGRRLPEPGTPAGHAALIDRFGLAVPLPEKLTAIGSHHRIICRDGWRILTPRHRPDASLQGHLTFALKHERLDLALLKRLFLTLDSGTVERVVRARPSGIYARRTWFLYEWLTGRTLDIPDSLGRMKYVAVMDSTKYFAGKGTRSVRHRVVNNLPGTPGFCPVVARTPLLDHHAGLDLAEAAAQVVRSLPSDLLSRSAAFLLLKDSKASYSIEGENPPRNRIERWGRAIAEAGRHPFDMEDLLRLQKILIGDTRFIRMGLRHQGGFVGEHDRQTREPLPVHISARPEDLDSLIRGMTAFERASDRHLDPVVGAAALAFGFVYAHPFVDGNGRIHRYLFHHVLARQGFAPRGVTFPVSAAILDDIEGYRRTLESYSRRLMPVIRWRPTDGGNVDVLNDTADFYRFFDATPHAEFLYKCVRRTVERDLPREADYLERHDEALRRIMSRVEMPDQLASRLLLFVRQNGGTLPVRRRRREFRLLEDLEVEDLEKIVVEAFDGFDER